MTIFNFFSLHDETKEDREKALLGATAVLRDGVELADCI